MLYINNSIKILGSLSLSLFACSSLAEVSIHDIKINGFATIAGVATNSNDAIYSEAGKDISFDTDSMAGLQFTVPVNERVKYNLQFIAKADEAYEVEPEWAFASFKLNQSTELRAGRLRIPFFEISDALEVGYSYPWVRPPIDSYAQFGFEEFTGVDTLYNVGIGESDLLIHPFFGTSNSNLEMMGMAGTFSVANLVGVNVVWDFDWISLRFGHTEGDFEVSGFTDLEPLADMIQAVSGSAEISDQFAISDRHGRFTGMGVTLEKNNVHLMSRILTKDYQWLDDR